MRVRHIDRESERQHAHRRWSMLGMELVEEQNLVEAIAPEALVKHGQPCPARDHKRLEAFGVLDNVRQCYAPRLLGLPIRRPSGEVGRAVALRVVLRVEAPEPAGRQKPTRLDRAQLGQRRAGGLLSRVRVGARLAGMARYTALLQIAARPRWRLPRWRQLQRRQHPYLAPPAAPVHKTRLAQGLVQTRARNEVNVQQKHQGRRRRRQRRVAQRVDRDQRRLAGRLEVAQQGEVEPTAPLRLHPRVQCGQPPLGPPDPAGRQQHCR
mmetsp:Transcript_31001/g.99062  ORF Transcript_31001/g.99062 Transcript_31001/m.99062 type:complete len:266 (-) Transcript_31001:284-1081(-)|eukprot:scaffold155_cov106-Isochrysis_galbana.AAC.9